MTLEDLLNIHEDEIKNISASDLQKMCEPFWHITRPELASQQPNTHKPTKRISQEDKDLQRRIAEAKQLAFEKLGLKIK